MNWTTRVLAAGIALLACPPLASAETDPAPTLLRRLRVEDYRSAAARPDGAALLVKREGVILRDPAGSTRFVARLRGNQRVATAPGARVFGIATYADNAPSTLHIARFELRDASGDVRWTIRKPRANEFRVSSDGAWTVGIAGGDGMHESELFLYDAEGREAGRWTVPYLSDLTLPESGDRFFAASRGALLSLPCAGGEPVSLGRYEAFAVSRDGRYVVLAGAGMLSLFEGTQLILTLPTELDGVRAATVSPEGGFVALAAGDRMELFDVKAGALAWALSSGKPNLHFVSLDIREHPCRVLCGLDLDLGPGAKPGTRHTRGAVYLLDRDGLLIWREDLTYSRWNFRLPRVAFTGNGRQFEVELAAEWRQYGLP